MAKQLQWVMIAVPAGKKLLAGKSVSQHSKNPADDDSFTAGFFDAQQSEWAIACWAIDKSTVTRFDALIAAHPDAKVAKWLDGVSTTEQELVKLGLSRPVLQMGDVKPDAIKK